MTNIKALLVQFETSLNIVLDEVLYETNLECTARIRGEVHCMLGVIGEFERRIRKHVEDFNESRRNLSEPEFKPDT